MADLVFADSETRSLLDLPKVGGYKYARHESTDCLVWTYAFDSEPGGFMHRSLPAFNA